MRAEIRIAHADFKLPELGENVHGGDVLRVLVNLGDTVANDQPVVELETDKATIEVPSSVAGTVKDINVKPGDKVKVGQTIFVFEAGQGGKDSRSRRRTRRSQRRKRRNPLRTAGRRGRRGRRESARRAAGAGDVAAARRRHRSGAQAPQARRGRGYHARPAGRGRGGPHRTGLPRRRRRRSAASPASSASTSTGERAAARRPDHASTTCRAYVRQALCGVDPHQPPRAAPRRRRRRRRCPTSRSGARSSASR